MRGGKLHYLLSAAFFALAVMTKGPIAVLLPGLIFILYFALTGAWKNIRSVPIFWMAIVFVCVAAPWYVVMYKVHGAAFMDAFFGFQNVTRFMKAEHEIGSQIYYNIPILLVGFFPWSVFLPFGIWYAFKKAANDKNMGAVFSLIWFFAIFLFFTASSTKLPTYIFPCFFAAALLTAAFWDAFLEKNCPRTVGKAMTVSFYTLIAIVIPGAVGTHIYLSGHFPSLVKGVTISAAILTFGMILSLAAFVSGKRAWAFVMIAYSMLLFIYPTSGLILPEIDRFETSRPAAKELAGRMAPADKIGSASRYMEGLAFYAGKFPRDLDKYDDMIRFLNGKDRVWCVLKAKNRTQAYIADDLPQCSRDTYLVYRMGKRAIVTNMLPRDGEYIVKKDGIK
jgi:4-amino-4-deoxy-L-arabinose transferase-like glycosyltransferase